MAKACPTADNDLDFYELMKTIWHGRWIICASITVGSLVGIWHLQDRLLKYEISAPVDVQIYSPSAIALCGTTSKCRKEETLKMIPRPIIENWRMDGNFSSFQKTTTQLLTVGEYLSELQRINSLLTDEVYFEAELTPNMLSRESNLFTDSPGGAQHLYFELSRRSIDRGRRVLVFDNISVDRKTPRASSVVALSAITGASVGVFFTLINAMIGKRKIKQYK
jgi:hypothetical protein